MTPVLELHQFHLRLPVYGGYVHALRGLDVQLYPGETLALVGESGCGKSLACLSLLGLLPKGHQWQGEYWYHGQRLDRHGDAPAASLWQSLRGRHLAMVFQDPMTALNPTMRIGKQLCEVARQHLGLLNAEAERKALRLLQQVGIADAPLRLRQYPHQCSGGMRQRIAIAMALMGDPEVLIADEPTTALDVTLQAQILHLLQQLQAERDIAMIFVSHDLGVVSHIAQRIAVMYAGQCIEVGKRDQILYTPQHPYTQALLRAHVAIDSPLGTLQPIAGSPPDLFSPPTGCAFVDRCPHAMRICPHQAPVLYWHSPEHRSRCWLQECAS